MGKKKKPAITPPQYLVNHPVWVDAYEAPLCEENLEGKVVPLAGKALDDEEGALLRKPVRRRIDAAHDEPRVIHCWEVPSRRWKPLNQLALDALVELGASDKVRAKNAKTEALRKKNNPPGWDPPTQIASESKPVKPVEPPKPSAPGPKTDRPADQTP